MKGVKRKREYNQWEGRKEGRRDCMGERGVTRNHRIGMCGEDAVLATPWVVGDSWF